MGDESPARKPTTGGPVKGTCPGVRSDTSHVTVPLATKEPPPARSQYISFPAPDNFDRRPPGRRRRHKSAAGRMRTGEGKRAYLI